MPGSELEEMTLRQARQAGKLGEWREARKEDQPERSTDASSTQKIDVTPGDTLAIRQLTKTALLDSLTIFVDEPVPGDYGVKIEVVRNETGISTAANIERGVNEFQDFDFDFELAKNDIVKLTLVDESSGGEVTPLSEVVTTIALSYA